MTNQSRSRVFLVSGLPLSVRGKPPARRRSALRGASPGVLLAIACLSFPALAAKAVAAEESSFEELRQNAAPVGDVANTLRPPEKVESCESEPTDRERARCRVVRRYIRKSLPHHPFRKISDDPAAVTLSDFDGTIKGYHLAVSGCLACERPVAIGPRGESRLVTVGVPDPAQKGALKDAVSLSRNAVTFGNLNEAKKWLAGNKDDLRAEFVFLPVQEKWTRGQEQGVGLAKVGVRVFNRCTGEVIVSQPPSQRPAEVDRNAPGCSARDSGNRGKVGDADSAGESGRRQLTRNDIADAMDKIRGAVNACYGQFHQPGRADLTFVVAPSGVPQAVTVGGVFNGTPTGDCAANAAKSAKFPSFDGPTQEFVYPFFLR
jgi:hypothetical protein